MFDRIKELLVSELGIDAAEVTPDAKLKGGLGISSVEFDYLLVASYAYLKLIRFAGNNRFQVYFYASLCNSASDTFNPVKGNRKSGLVVDSSVIVYFHTDTDIEIGLFAVRI